MLPIPNSHLNNLENINNEKPDGMLRMPDTCEAHGADIRIKLCVPSAVRSKHLDDAQGTSAAQ